MATRIEIDVELGPALTSPPPVQPYLKAGMDASVELVRAAGERNLTGGKVKPSNKPRRKTGAGYGPLAGSLTTLVVPFGPTDGVAGYVRTPVFYARFLEYGTKAHPITAKHRRAGGRPGVLAWGPPSKLTFRRAVKHPGLRARFWMRDAADGERPGVERAFEDQIAQWTATFHA